PIRLQLTVAGSFVSHEEKTEFDQYLASTGDDKSLLYLGFVNQSQKRDALIDADFFSFPTFYQNKNQPVNLIEAMAFGLPILTTRWRSIPELFPPDYRFLVDIKSPD